MSTLAPEHIESGEAVDNLALSAFLIGSQAVRQFVGEINTQFIEGWRIGLNITRAVGLIPKPIADVYDSVLDANAALSERFSKSYEKQPFNIEVVNIDGTPIAVAKETHVETLEKPFGGVVHFERATERNDPKLLMVAPLSGHYETLVKETVETVLPDHDTYLSYWNNARDIPVSEGAFGLEDYIDYVKDAILELDPKNLHIMAICQPGPAVLAAVASIAAENPEFQPASLTIIGSPIDAHAAPTEVVKLAQNHPIEDFEQFISEVPAGYPGESRLIYPGLVQLTAFVAMNPERHMRAHMKFWRDVMDGNEAEISKHKDFYDEYFAVMDMPAEFYLETDERIFQNRELAAGTMKYHGKLIDLGAIKRTALLTIEGEKDDICAPGQTLAAHDLCTNLPKTKKRHHLQPGTGHYGIFSGRRWQSQVYPIVRNHILQSSNKNIKV